MSKVWFITGSNSGIGLGIAKVALATGDRVVATRLNMQELTAAFSDVSYENLELLRFDVSERSQALNAIADAVEWFGQINFYGTVNVLRADLPTLRKHHACQTINISSTAGAVGLKHCSAYCATKFAVKGLSMAIATEVEQFCISVTVIEPGFVRANLIDKGSAKYAAQHDRRLCSRRLRRRYVVPSSPMKGC